MACRPMCTSPPPTGSSRSRPRRTAPRLGGGAGGDGVEVALDEGFQGGGVQAHGRTLHARTQRGGEVPGAGDRQIAHLPAAHIGRVGTVDPVAARRATPTSPAHLRRRPRPRAPAGVPPSTVGESAASQATATCSGPRTVASATASQCPAERGGRASSGVCATQRGLAGRGVPLGASASTRWAAVMSASVISEAPAGVAPSTGSAGRTIRASASSAVSNQRPVRSGSAKCASAVSISPAAAVSQCCSPVS